MNPPTTSMSAKTATPEVAKSPDGRELAWPKCEPKLNPTIFLDAAIKVEEFTTSYACLAIRHACYDHDTDAEPYIEFFITHCKPTNAHQDVWWPMSNHNIRISTLREAALILQQQNENPPIN